MDWTTLISIAGIIGTWVTIVLVYNTLREMRNQRIASQKPDLIITESSKNIGLYAYREEGKSRLLIPRLWNITEPIYPVDLTKVDPHGWLESYPVKLYNVGFGVAKNIKLKWTVEYDNTIQKMKDYCYQHSMPIVLQIEKFETEENGEVLETDGLCIYDHGEVLLMNFSLSPETFTYDFLMPVSITKEGLTSFAPDIIKEIASILIYLEGDRLERYQDEKQELVIDIPPIKLELDYDDVEDSHYSKRFDITVPHGCMIPEEKTTKAGLKWVTSLSFEFKMRK